MLKGDPKWLGRIPAHKTLFGTGPGKGLPIGNLNSQFFANVYLNALDQFVKHTLKCSHYLRYCDDFVLLAEGREQLVEWRQRIRCFLRERLHLQLNDARERLRPVADGVDFLGYIVRADYLLATRRVVGNMEERLALDAGGTAARRLQVPRRDFRRVGQQYAHYCREFPGDVVLMQVGAFVEFYAPDPSRRTPRLSSAATASSPEWFARTGPVGGVCWRSRDGPRALARTPRALAVCRARAAMSRQEAREALDRVQRQQSRVRFG